MFAAGKKTGVVPHNLEHARLILSDNVFVLPRQGTQFDALHHWPVPHKNIYSTIAVLVMARTMQEFAAKLPEAPPDLMTDALALEQRGLDAIKAGLSEITLDKNSQDQYSSPHRRALEAAFALDPRTR